MVFFAGATGDATGDARQLRLRSGAALSGSAAAARP